MLPLEVATPASAVGGGLASSCLTVSTFTAGAGIEDARARASTSGLAEAGRASGVGSTGFDGSWAGTTGAFSVDFFVPTGGGLLDWTPAALACCFLTLGCLADHLCLPLFGTGLTGLTLTILLWLSSLLMELLLAQVSPVTGWLARVEVVVTVAMS